MAINFSDLGGGGGGKFQKTEWILSTQSWTCPADVTEVELFCGGGGGGGGRTGASDRTAQGGCGSAYETVITVVPSTSYTITIGAGGVGNGSSSPGGNGGTTTFGAIFTAEGGDGGWTSHETTRAPKGGGGNGGFVGGLANSYGVGQTRDATPGMYGRGGGGGASDYNGIAFGTHGGGTGYYQTATSYKRGQPNSGAGGMGGFQQIDGQNGGSGFMRLKYWTAA